MADDGVTTSLAVGVLTERAAHERRVALDPDAASRLVKAGRTVLVEAGAGLAASFPDSSYVSAGAVITDRADVLARCDALAAIHLPEADTLAALRSGQLLIGLLDPLVNASVMAGLASSGVTVVALELLPRTLSRAQSMDALSSQSSAAGYRAAIVAAESYGRYLPMMITASGTARPASAIVIGAGVAGLQAIATLKRLGAVVTGYDVRAASRGEVESLGAQFLTTSVEGSGTGGYARAMTPEEQATQQAELAAALTDFDIIVTTARVPGRTPPVLVTAETLAALKPGTVCVDLGASAIGGNVAGSVEHRTIVTDHGVVVVGAGDLAADLPASASQMFGRNIAAVLASLAPHGELQFDATDEVHNALVVANGGQLLNTAVKNLLEPAASASTSVGIPEKAVIA